MKWLLLFAAAFAYSPTSSAGDTEACFAKCDQTHLECVSKLNGGKIDPQFCEAFLKGPDPKSADVTKACEECENGLKKCFEKCFEEL